MNKVPLDRKSRFISHQYFEISFITMRKLKLQFLWLVKITSSKFYSILELSTGNFSLGL